jgi:hypothetical protein
MDNKSTTSFWGLTAGNIIKKQLSAVLVIFRNKLAMLVA